MIASRNICSSEKKALALSLFLSLLCGQWASSNPPSTQASPKKNSSESIVNSNDKGKAAGENKGTEATHAVKEAAAATGESAESTSAEDSKQSTQELSSEEAKEAALEKSVQLKMEEEEANIEKQHDSAIFHWNLSKQYYKQNDIDLTETELDLAVLNWPEMQVAHRDLCVLSMLRFNVGRCIAEFMMTVGLGDPVPMTESEGNKLKEDGMIKHYKKGLVYARQEAWPKVVNELELAANLVPTDFAVQRSLAYAYGNIGNFEKAEEHYKQTFDLAPSDGSSRADLAYLLAKNGKVDAAKKEMEEAVKTQPKAAAYHVDLSWMAESDGDLQTASKEMQTALGLSPKHANLWAHLGRLFEKQGDKSQAVEAYTKALSLDPQLADAKEALAKLQTANTGSAVQAM
jgi:Flp pilus assembly protein TadD